MKDFYCLEIRFNEAIIEDRSWLHSHLKIDQDEIELKVFYSGEIDISRKYFEWSSNNKDWNKLSLYSEIKISSSENELLDVNTEDSKITGLKSGEIDANGNYYLTILLDSIVISKPPVSELNNTARILLNEQGFDLVKGFYSIFTQVKKDVFDIQRMNGMETFYRIEKSKFRPEFEFNTSDNTNNPKPYIEKVPIIKFQLHNLASEDQVLNYFTIACKITSFYLGINVDYFQGEINLKNKRVLVFKKLKKQINQNISSLNHFLDVRGTDGFLKLEWQNGFFENQEKIIRSINNFITARLLDKNSKFLVLFNTIEICMNGFKPKAKKFELAVSKKEKSKVYKKAYQILESTIVEEDLSDFKNKWENVKKNLVYKPMDSPLKQFLIDNNIDVDRLNISITKMKNIRNNIIHGSLEKVDKNELEEANFQLFRINTIIIFNLLGINNWKNII